MCTARAARVVQQSVPPIGWSPSQNELKPSRSSVCTHARSGGHSGRRPLPKTPNRTRRACSVTQGWASCGVVAGTVIPAPAGSAIRPSPVPSARAVGRRA